MEAKIITQKKNPFLEREEITMEIKNATAPTFDDVKKEIGKDEALTVVKKVGTNFGRQSFNIEAVVYDSAEAKEKIETIPQKVRKKMAAEKKTADEAAAKAKAEEEAAEAAPEAEATPAAAPAEEAPAETPVKPETKAEEPAKEEEKTE